MTGVPAVVVAAPASGSGKTTIATGLLGAFTASGRRAAPFKVGPDYIDPGYHGLAAGRIGRNLDPVLVGEHRIGGLYAHGSDGCDVAVIEGVMGLFDGRIPLRGSQIPGNVVPESWPPDGSTAQVARILGAPVVLVVDGRGHSQSLAATVHGFVSLAADVHIAGVIVNRVASARHEAVLTAACARVGVPVLGAVPSARELEVPARHLGLVPAIERTEAAVTSVAAMTELVSRHVDLEEIFRIAAIRGTTDHWTPADGLTTSPGARIALAGGAAFSFGYAEHEEMLMAAGAEVLRFDPLVDELPSGTTGLILPGGFPEQFAQPLSANVALRAQISELIAAGAPVLAECAGMLYLVRELDGIPMVGAIDARAHFSPKLTLGYRQAVALQDSYLYPAGARVMGHEFHRTQVAVAAEPAYAWGWRDDDGPVREGFISGRVHASYLHTHPAGNPDAVARFVAAAS